MQAQLQLLNPVLVGWQQQRILLVNEVGFAPLRDGAPDLARGLPTPDRS